MVGQPRSPPPGGLLVHPAVPSLILPQRADSDEANVRTLLAVHRPTTCHSAQERPGGRDSWGHSLRGCSLCPRQATCHPGADTSCEDTSKKDEEVTTIWS